MKKTELVRTLLTFTSEERKKFIGFLQSPYCVRNQPTASSVKLVELIFKAADTEEIGGLAEDTIYLNLYPHKSHILNRDLSNLRSITLKLLKKFIVMETALSSPKVTKRLDLLDFYTKKGLFHYAERSIDRVEKWINTNRRQDESDYISLLRFRKIKSFYLFHSAKNSRELELLEFIDDLNSAYQYTVQKYVTMIAAQQNSNSIDQKRFEELSALFKQTQEFGTFQSTKIASLFSLAFDLLDKDNFAPIRTYEAFSTQLKSAETWLTKNDLANFMAYGRIYLSKCFNQGDHTLLHDLFETQLEHIEKVQQTDSLTPTFFLSVVKAGLSLAKTDWVSQWIEKQQNRETGTETRWVEALVLSQSLLLFSQKKYNEATMPLLTTNFVDTQFKCQAKVLEIKIHYEAKDEQVHNRTHAAKMFFRRSKGIPDQQSKAYSEFINFMLRILRPEIGIDRLKTLRLQAAIEADTHVAEHRWLKSIIAAKVALVS